MFYNSAPSKGKLLTFMSRMGSSRRGIRGVCGIRVCAVYECVQVLRAALAGCPDGLSLTGASVALALENRSGLAGPAFSERPARCCHATWGYGQTKRASSSRAACGSRSDWGPKRPFPTSSRRGPGAAAHSGGLALNGLVPRIGAPQS